MHCKHPHTYCEKITQGTSEHVYYVIVVKACNSSLFRLIVAMKVPLVLVYAALYLLYCMCHVTSICCTVCVTLHLFPVLYVSRYIYLLYCMCHVTPICCTVCVTLHLFAALYVSRYIMNIRCHTHL